MNELLGHSILEKNLTLKPEILLGTLLLSFILGTLLSWCYKISHNGISYSRSTPFSLMLVPVIISSILMAIGSSIALSLGLVGSLSILRFRTAVRDIRDMVFIFASVGIGLSCGSGNFSLAIITTVFFICIVFISDHIKWLSKSEDEYLLTLFGKSISKEPEKIYDLLNQNTKKWSLKSQLEDKDSSELVFVVIFDNQNKSQEFTKNIKETFKEDIQLRLIAPESTVLF